MATIEISGNNCYADLHIYTNNNALTGNNEEYYSSLQHNKAKALVLNHQKAILSTKVFKNAKLLTLKNVLILCTILVFSVSSLFIGYVTGKSARKKRDRQHPDHKDEARFKTTNGTPLSTTTGNVIPNGTKRTDSSSTATNSTEITTDRNSTVKVPTGAYMFDGYGVKDARSNYLNGMDTIDDDHMRFLVTMETTDTYRIRTKATGRYLRMDRYLHVTSMMNIKDSSFD